MREDISASPLRFPSPTPLTPVPEPPSPPAHTSGYSSLRGKPCHICHRPPWHQTTALCIFHRTRPVQRLERWSGKRQVFQRALVSGPKTSGRRQAVESALMAGPKTSGKRQAVRRALRAGPKTSTRQSHCRQCCRKQGC